jgi:hypothetical protein
MDVGDRLYRIEKRKERVIPVNILLIKSPYP